MIKELKTTVNSLKELNFTELIELSIDDLTQYTFRTHLTKFNRHHPINGFCTSCEEKEINKSVTDSNFHLRNISHGSHSIDFIDSLSSTVDISDWHYEPVMFVYEAPSIDYGIYEEHTSNGIEKCPSKDWYWIHNISDASEYPDYFAGGFYGEYVLSAIMTFKLANAYMTNLVKCGLNNLQNKFQGISNCKPECVKNCFERFLLREIEIHSPLVIFAVGSAVEGWLRYLLPKERYIQQLPHPAGRRRGFKNEHYRTLYFWLVVQALYKEDILSKDEIERLSIKFVKKFS